MSKISVLEKGPGRYYSRVYHAGKYWTVGTFETREQAEVEAVAYLERVLPGVGRGLTRESPFAEAAAKYLRTKEGELSRDSLRNLETIMRRHVLPTWGKTAVGAIVSSDLKLWLKTLESRPATRRGAYLALRATLKMLVEDDVLLKAPIVRGGSNHADRKRPTYTEAQVWSVLDALASEVRIACLVQYGLSARISEVLGLNWSDVDLDTGRVSIHQQYFKGQMKPHTKTKKDRIVTMAGWALEALWEHRRTHPAIGASPVFLNYVGERLASHTVYTAWDVARRRVDLPDITPHAMRHVSLSAYQRITGDLVQTMARGGHRDHRSALVYQHAADEDSATIDEFSKRTAKPA